MTQHRRTLDIAIATLIALVTAAIYGQTAGHQYVQWDDGLYVVNNAHVHALNWANAFWAWDTVGYGSVWSPLLWHSFQTDAAMGLGSGGMHIENAILHAIAGILTYALVLRLSGQRWTAAVVALLWFVHPLCVESVAWVSERKNTLSQAFFLLALLAYHRHCLRPGLGRLALVIVAGAAAMLVKPSTVILPPLMLAMGYLLLRRRNYLRLVLEQLPLLLGAVVVGLFTIWAETSGGSLQQPGTVALALQGLATYLRQAVWPVDLYYLYNGERADLWLSAAGGVALVALLCAAWTQRATRPLVTFGIVWFIAGWLLICGYPKQVGLGIHADRFIYLPLAGLILAVVASLPRVGVQLLAVALIPLATASYCQAEHWATTKALLTHAAHGNPYDPIVVQSESDSKPFADAIAIVRNAIEHQVSTDDRDLVGLYVLLYQRNQDAGQLEQAKAALRELMSKHPHDTRIYRSVLQPAQVLQLPEYEAEIARLSQGH